MQELRGREKLNNKGFTLVELLVAITILAIIVGPMLHAFVTTAFMNAKARKNFHSYTVTEDIMEGLKSNTVEEISKMTTYPANAEDPFNIIAADLFTSGAVGASNVCELEPTDIANGEYQKATTPHIVEDSSNPADIKYNFTESADGKYYYYVGDLKPHGYDALITLDASPYRGTGGFNDVKMVTLSSVKGDNNAVFLQKKNDFDLSGRNPGETLYNMAKTANPTIGATALPMDNIYRTIRVNISKYTKGTPVADYKKVTVTYEYNFKGTGFTAAGPDANVSTVYDKKITTDVDLDNIYIFYQPMYLSSSGVVRDNIIIENADNLPVNVYLIKQEIDLSKYASETSVSGSLSIAESSYFVQVDVQTTGGGPASSETKFSTNLGYNMAIDPSTGLSNVLPNQVRYSYRGTNTNALDVRNLSSKESKDRYFDMTVELFPKGCRSGDSFLFKEDDKLYAIQGSTLE